MTKKGAARAILDEEGIDMLIARIESGESMSEIAEALSVSVGSLWNYLHETPERTERSARAMQTSAESWVDRGLNVLKSGLSKQSDIDPTVAKAYEQACARRAAIRNPRYRDKQDVQHSGSINVMLNKQDDEI